jgi:hypothetical protein
MCHERLPANGIVGGLNSNERPLDVRVTSIADGRLGGEKQDAIYIRLASPAM